MSENVFQHRGFDQQLTAMQNKLDRLQSSGGGGTSDGMDERVTRLETHFEYVRRDLDEIKADLKGTLARLNEMPTKADLWQWKWQWTALALAAVAIVIGGIIGGLSWIQPAPAPAGTAPTPAPIVIQVPQPQAAPKR